MTRESADVKGRRMLTEGRLTVTRINNSMDSDGVISGRCRGDDGAVYSVRWTLHGGWHCTCPAKGNCSHLVALKLVTVAHA